MKLDKFKFAKVVWYLVWNCKADMNEDDFRELDNIINIDVPEAISQPACNPETLYVLMALMAEGSEKDEAIKHYSMMTGYGLKESKDIVEKYWVNRSND